MPGELTSGLQNNWDVIPLLFQDGVQILFNLI